jgi:hypothetical protein
VTRGTNDVSARPWLLRAGLGPVSGQLS